MTTKPAHTTPFPYKTHKKRWSIWTAIQPWLLPSAFVMGLLGTAVLINHHDFQQTQNELIRDTRRIQYIIRTRLQTNQDFVNNLVHPDLSSTINNTQEHFQMRAHYFLTTNPELEGIIWRHEKETPWVAALHPRWLNRTDKILKELPCPSLSTQATSNNAATYFALTYAQKEFVLYSCQNIETANLRGTLISIYPLNRLIRHVVP